MSAMTCACMSVGKPGNGLVMMSTPAGAGRRTAVLAIDLRDSAPPSLSSVGDSPS